MHVMGIHFLANRSRDHSVAGQDDLGPNDGFIGIAPLQSMPVIGMHDWKTRMKSPHISHRIISMPHAGHHPQKDCLNGVTLQSR